MEGILSMLKLNAVIHSTELIMVMIVWDIFVGQRGKRAAGGVSMVCEKNDFTRFEQCPFWYYCSNQRGQLKEVDFPVKFKTILSNSE